MTSVVIPDILPRTQAIAVGAQTVYSTDWTANFNTDVKVYSRAAGVEANDATQILPPQLYSVAFIGLGRIVQVTLVNPSTIGDIVTIIRDTPADRLNLYTNTNFTPNMLNNDFGILTLVDQQAQLVNQRIGPRYNYSAIIDPVVDTILPILPPNCTWVKNADDDEIVIYELPASGIAPDDATYITLTDETATLPESIDLEQFGDGLLVNVAGVGFVARTLTGTTNQIAILNGNGVAGAPTFSISDNPILPGTAGMGIPSGTTAQRVTPSSNIGLRYNTSFQSLEFWDGSTWTQIEDSGDFATILALLASHAPGEGASLIGLQTSGTVQDFYDAQQIANASFLLKAGGTMLGDLILFSLTPPTNLSAAPKGYVDTVAQGRKFKDPVDAASTVTLTVTYNNGSSGIGATLTNAGAQAAFAIDGYSAVLGDRILIKNQSSTFQNGIYVITVLGTVSTNWVLTRSTDMDLAAEFKGATTIILNGTTQQGQTWTETATVVTVGTDAVTFVQTGDATGVTSVATGTGLTGGPITSTGTISFAAVAAGRFWANLTGGSAVPSETPITAFGAEMVADANAAAGLVTLGLGVPTGTGNVVRQTSPTLITPILGAASATSLTFSSTSGIIGTTTNDAAALGSVGQLLSDTKASGAGVSLTTANAANIAQITLTSGDWDIWGNGFVIGTAVTGALYGLGTTTATLPDLSVNSSSGGSIFNAGSGSTDPGFRVSVAPAATVTYFLVVNASFASTATACGGIYARRRR